MGRTGAGVEVREKSIRFTFLEGKPTLMRDGVPLPPTPAALAGWCPSCASGAPRIVLWGGGSRPAQVTQPTSG